MEISHDKTSNKSTLNRFLPFAIIVLLLLFIAALVYRYSGEKRFAIIKFYGQNQGINYSKYFNSATIKKTGDSACTMLVEAGDLIEFDDFNYYVDNIIEDSIRLEFRDSLMVLANGKVNAIIISKDKDLLPWFRLMKNSDIETLKTIIFTSKIPAAYIPYIKEIGRLKPNIALQFLSNDSVDIIKDVIEHADFFTPHFISVVINKNNVPQIAHWQSVESIYLGIEDSIANEPLPAMPALKECILLSNYADLMPASFLKNNTQIKKLTVNVASRSTAWLQPFRKLEELVIISDDTVELALYKNLLSQLSVLIISGESTGTELIGDGKKLRWLGVPFNISQKQFDSITKQLPSLQVIEMLGSGKVKNLSGLVSLTNLRGLVIMDTVTDIKSLQALKQLNYLSIHQGNYKDSSVLASLQKSLPGCIIVPNSGACLGSGWLLLLLPMVLLFLVILRNKAVQSPVVKSNEYDHF
ncbi:hypothetical protein BH10BAC3_BH10BAC3_03580 [soil metagenome]